MTQKNTLQKNYAKFCLVVSGARLNTSSAPKSATTRQIIESVISMRSKKRSKRSVAFSRVPLANSRVPLANSRVPLANSQNSTKPFLQRIYLRQIFFAIYFSIVLTDFFIDLLNPKNKIDCKNNERYLTIYQSNQKWWAKIWLFIK